MGVRRSDYILIGADIGHDKYDDNKYEEYEEYDEISEEDEITYLIDGYGGDYFIIGVVLYCDEYGENGFPVYEIDKDDLNGEQKERVKKHIKDRFDLDVEPKLIVLTHWS